MSRILENWESLSASSRIVRFLDINLRSVGQVTPVVTCMPGTWVASAPITDQTNGLWPCSSFQGW